MFGPLHDLLLARLIDMPGLIFVGEREYIDYLAGFFGAASPHVYVHADEPVRGWERQLVGRNALVVASDDEDAIVAKAERLLAQVGRPLRIVRMFADLFVNAMSGGDLLQTTSGEPTLPKVAYGILGTPRCGSEFLCEALTSTQVAGSPQEHLRTQSEVITKYCRFDVNRYLRILMSRRVTPNGVFGTKLISHFLMDHIKQSSALERTLVGFKFIRLGRKDIIGQAISAMLALRTEIYHVRDEPSISDYAERLTSVQIRPEDLRVVDQLCRAFATQNRQMDEFLLQHGITPLLLTYEDLIEQPVASVNTILSFLNIPAKIESVPVSVRKTRSALSNAVRAMYLADSRIN